MFSKKLKARRGFCRRNTEAGYSCPSSRPQLNSNFDNTAKIFRALRLNANTARVHCFESMRSLGQGVSFRSTCVITTPRRGSHHCSGTLQLTVHQNLQNPNLELVQYRSLSYMILLPYRCCFSLRLTFLISEALFQLRNLWPTPELRLTFAKVACRDSGSSKATVRIQ